MRALPRASMRSSAFLAGLVLLSAIPFASAGAAVTYEHYPNGRLKKATYTDGTIVEYSYDANGNRTAAAVTTPPPDTTPPGAPGTPSFSNLTMTSAKATWTAATDNIGVVGYEYRLGSGSWQALANVLTVDLSSLSAATSYTFQVRAKDAASNIGTASSNSFTTPDTAAPTTPTGLNGTAASSSAVNLSWNASTDNVAVTGYRVYRNGAHITDRTTTSYSDTGLSTGTQYSYQVSAFDAATNVSALSTAVTPFTLPGVPSSVSVPSSSPTGSFTISWTAVSGTVTAYELYQATNSGFTGQTLAYSGSTASAGLSGRGDGQYWYRVRACNASGCGGYQAGANPITVLLPPGTPGAPSVPSSSPTGSYTVSWGSSGGSVSSYNLYEATNPGFSGEGLVYSGGALSTGISGRGNGTYYYRVRACNASGCSSYSAGPNGITVAIPIQVLNPSLYVTHSGMTTGITTFATLNGNAGTLHSISLPSCSVGSAQIVSGSQSVSWNNSNFYYEECAFGSPVQCTANYVIRNSGNGQLHNGTASVTFAALPISLPPGQQCN